MYLIHQKKIAKMGGDVSKVARDNLEKKLGKFVITSANNLDYRYEEKKELIDK